MATRSGADQARRRAALEVLTTDVVGDPVAEQATWALVTMLSTGAAQPLQLDPLELEQARAFAERHRVTGLLSRLLPGESGGGVIALAGAIEIERRLLEAAALLGRAGVANLVLKGNATAHLDHRTPSDREVGDIDLLVRAHDLDSAMAALESTGCTRAITHPFSSPSFFHSETFVHPQGTEIDLHHRLSQPSKAPVTCWDRPDTFSLGGVTLSALPRSWRFLHALVHQMMNPPPSTRAVNGLTDLVVMWTAGVDVAEVRAAAAEIKASHIAERGMARLADLLGVARPAAPARDSSGWAERRLAEALDSDRPTPGYLALAANLAVQPIRRWPRYVGDLLWPSAAYREQQGTTPRSQLRHVVNEALGR
ncbi:MAG: nucleotidyltransferase family protein [Acidimicrobiia bacterium]